MTSDEDKLVAIAATEIDRLHRLAQLGERDTAGPDSHLGIVDVSLPPAPRWDDGWWIGAWRSPAHPGRIGGPISPCCSVVHTTDMVPEEWQALVLAWTSRAGEGSCAHFLIGRDPQQGVVQLAPVNRNANHAGGLHHGIYLDGAGRAYHPNTVAVGIELHCAGGVMLIGGEWHLVEGGKVHGQPLPARDVDADPDRAGRGWHVVTDYQRTMLGLLTADLELVLAPMPQRFQAKSIFEQTPAWGIPKTARVVGHVSLDTRDRSDPWPPMMSWLRAR